MKYKCFFFLLFIVSSCKTDNDPLFEFNPISVQESKITLSEMADDISYIPLDNIYTLDLIYDKIYIFNNSIYLSIRDIGVLVFERTGKTLRKIGNIGRGPGEYIINYLFAVDNKTEKIYVLNSGDIIKVYSKNGKFIRDIPLREYGKDIDAIEIYNSYLFASFEIQDENNKYKWVIVDSLGNLVKKEEKKTLPFSSRVFSAGGANIFQNRITYWNSYYTDTVFSIPAELTETPNFIINQGELEFPRSMIIIPPTDLEKFFSLRQVLETDHFLTIRYRNNGKRDFVLIDKKDKNVYLTNWEIDGSGGIKNDMDGGLEFLPKSYFVENGIEYMAGLINPYQLKNHIANTEFKNSNPEFPEKKRELENLANSLKETDNPIIVLVRLKK